MKMSPERWREVEELFHAALEREGEERAAFLIKACRGDEELRREVEAMISAHEREGSFIDSPALAELETDSIKGTTPTLPAGQKVGRYEVLALLGRGGMGEVYLARDPRLGREVALKLLPALLTQDKDWVRRFEREATTASKLNHPNVCTIYEVDETEDGRHYIAMEYIEGCSLRERLKTKRLKLGEALDIGIQIASALTAAHAAGVIHRDIKPENIMLRKDGLVKVLDFGLAKLLTHEKFADRTDVPTDTFLTDPGAAMGTPRYMAPEQVWGQAVDGRADVWSLGVVLYEIVTGHAPFEGATTSDLIVAILKVEPAPIYFYLPDASTQLQRIIKKALTKEVDERYQDVRDLWIDLRSLRRELESAAQMDATFPPNVSSDGAGKSVDAPKTTNSNESPPLQVTLSLNNLVTQTKKHKRAATFILLLVLLTTIGTGIGIYRSTRFSKGPVVFQNKQITRLMAAGNVRHVAISSDGQHIAYVKDEAGRQSLYVRGPDAEGAAILVPADTRRYKGVTFSPDGKSVYYVLSNSAESAGDLYRVASPLPTTPKRICSGLSSPVSFPPDGSRIVFVRNKPAEGESDLMIIDSDGAEERIISALHTPEYFAIEGPAWSPDGSTIACSKISYRPKYHEDLVGVKIADGESKNLMGGTWANIGKVSWLRDGSGLVFIGRGHQDNPQGRVTSQDFQSQDQLWHVSYPGGLATRITNDVNRYRDLSISGEMNSLVTIQVEFVSSIWVSRAQDKARLSGRDARPQNDSALDVQLIRGSNKYQGVDGLAYGPDGRIFYTSYESSRRAIWSIRDDGKDKVLLTDDPYSNRSPAVSPDGRLIAYASTRGGERNIWLMNSDGSKARQLTQGKLESDPCFSPDGKWVVFTGIGGNSTKPVLWKIATEGGAPTQLNDKFSAHPSVSPDGESIAFFQSESANAPLRLTIIPFTGGTPTAQFEVSLSLDVDQQPIVRWGADGSSVIFALNKNGVSNLWSQALSGGGAKQITFFTSDEIFWFDLSHDGKQLVLSRVSVEGDLVLIKNST